VLGVARWVQGKLHELYCHRFISPPRYWYSLWKWWRGSRHRASGDGHRRPLV